jgi:hypothetical protein
MTFEETITLLGIKDFEIIDYLRKELPPYTKVGTPFYCPDKYHSLKYHRHIILEYERSKQFWSSLSLIDLESKEDDSENSSSLKLADEKKKKAKSKSPEWTQEISEEEVLKNENKISALESVGHDLNSWKYLRKKLSYQEIEDLIIELFSGYFLFEEVIEHKKQGNAGKQTEDRKSTMFKMAGPQLEELYSILLKEFTSWPSEDKIIIQEFVINAYNKDRDSFNFIKIDYLRDEGLYIFNRERHTREDFIGRLFVKTAPDFGLNIKNAQTIYRDYKIFKKTSTKVD